MPHTDQLEKERERLNSEDLEREKQCGLCTMFVVLVCVFILVTFIVTLLTL